MEDIEFGLPIAKYIADKEIGQTIIVKNKTVIAVEGVEGTDQAIARGCRLANGKCVAIKVSRTGQDFVMIAPVSGRRLWGPWRKAKLPYWPWRLATSCSLKKRRSWPSPMRLAYLSSASNGARQFF